MSKAKIDWGIIVSFVFTAIFGLLCFGALRAIHSPVAPAAINLPIGDQNRTETLHLQGTRYGISSDAYIIRYDVTLQTLPRSAWCDQGGNSESKLFLDCTWPTLEQPVHFASAQIEVPVAAAEGVAGWEFNRESLQAVPVMQEWLFFNFGYLLFFVLFGLLFLLIGFVFICSCLNAKERARKNRLAAA